MPLPWEEFQSQGKKPWEDFKSDGTAEASARAQAGITRAQALRNGASRETPVNTETGQPAGVPGFSPNNYSRSGSAAMGAANSTTFGFGDEIASLLGSALIGVPRKQVLQEMRADDAKAQADNFGSYLGGQIGGGLAQGIATGGAGFGLNAAQTGGTLGRVALGSALDGALYGGLLGAGNANGDSADRAKGGLLGGAAGLAGGAVAPYLVAGASAAAKPLIAPIMARLQPQNYADAALTEALSRSGRTPAQIAQTLADAQADNQGMFTLADALGNAGQRMLSTAARNPHEGRQTLVEALQQRQMGQGDRLANALSEGFAAPDTAVQRAATLTGARNAAADVNYAAARQGAGPVDVSGAIAAANDVLTPGVNRLVNPGSGIADDSLEGAVRRARNLLTDGQSQVSDFNSVLRAKQDIADQIETAVRTGKGNQARILGQINRQLDAALEGASPGYRQANDLFRTQSNAINAVDTGRAAASGRTRAPDNIQTFNGLSPAEQSAFRAGYVDPLIAKVESASNSPTTNKARMLMTEKTGQEFPVFSAPGRGDQMGTRIAREQRMFETANSALGGSKTADNLADAADLNKFDPTIMTNLMQGRPVAAVIAGVTKALNESRGLPPSVLTRLSQSLMETDPAAARLLLSTGTARNLNASGRRAIYSAVLSRIAGPASVLAVTGN
ncbi:hypothetical protein [Mesorhizobium sp. M4B.F.Ca.ET.143.01.1.1]|uniref:hypothetical protein n=1 Tax=Mesorhizobium sp. M4B.F.Ca.ET.143.01.1.1 TaxID=2563947 RepID=UPI001FEF1AB8|nr:hypothetical protein [Mesorhizobium sp. M4B.F.Ca.ET.143.01.1.1]